MEEHEARGLIIAALAANVPGTIEPDTWFPDRLNVGRFLVHPDGTEATMDAPSGDPVQECHAVYIRFSPASATLIAEAVRGWWSAHGSRRVG